MTKEEQNQIIKDAMAKNLQKETDIPEDIGRTYEIWLQGLVTQASKQFMQQSSKPQETQQPAQGQQEQEAS